MFNLKKRFRTKVGDIISERKAEAARKSEYERIYKREFAKEKGIYEAEIWKLKQQEALRAAREDARLPRSGAVRKLRPVARGVWAGMSALGRAAGRAGQNLSESDFTAGSFANLADYDPLTGKVRKNRY